MKKVGTPNQPLEWSMDRRITYKSNTQVWEFSIAYQFYGMLCLEFSMPLLALG